MSHFVRVALGVVLVTGCAHNRLSSSELSQLRRPALLARIAENTTARAQVFRADATYQNKLRRLNPAEADRRLAVKLAKGMTRFEVGERLRTATLAHLPKAPPWTQAIPAANVASALQSFLVEEVPANAPDYELLRPLGTDGVLEFVVEEYGMRSAGGRAGVFVTGYARLFMIDGGEVWRRPFRRDQVKDGKVDLDPFRVGREPELYRRELATTLEDIGKELAKDLTPSDWMPPSAPATSDEVPAPEPAKPPASTTEDDLPPGELPAPDPDPPAVQQPPEGSAE